MVPTPGSPFACKAGWRLGLPYLLRLSGLVCLLLFTFVLVLAFCSVEHALEFHFVASSLELVFISLSCFCLRTLLGFHVRAYLILAISPFGIHLAFVWFYWVFRICTFWTFCMAYYPRFSGFYLSLCKFFFLNVCGMLLLFGFASIFAL